MSGISLSKNDKLLIGLSIFLPPLATFLKFGKSKTLATNCVLTACLFIPGIVHAIRSICSYPSVVFRGKREPKDKFTTRDNSVIWEIPRDHFQSINLSVRMLEAQNSAVKSAPARIKSIAGLSLVSGTKSHLATCGDSYMAYMHGQAPLLNPSYGWGPAALSQPLPVGVPAS
ncbi:hypothetical protein LPJ56_002787 [Coemansia sp. RSA 2599]|nr:hypothetical protein LPJ75_002495 [Coemansia sp. RSA 2598]KAJ1824814.1 hypothetical protein LPJ56_002787 [Coemansia sp. RSA 2599]